MEMLGSSRSYAGYGADECCESPRQNHVPNLADAIVLSLL